MVGLIRGGQAGEFIAVGLPVEVSAVHDAAAHLYGVAVHVFGSGVGHNVGAPLKGPAVDRGGEGVVHDEGNAVAVGRGGEPFNV